MNNPIGSSDEYSVVTLEVEEGASIGVRIFGTKKK